MKTSINVHEVLRRHMLADGMDLAMDLGRSHGSWIVDQRDGTEYLDLYTMYASQAIGYNHPKMLEISDVLARAATQKPICSDIYTVEMAQFMEVFGRVAIPAYLPHTFFIEGGALVVENALKAAFDWKNPLQPGHWQKRYPRRYHYSLQRSVSRAQRIYALSDQHL